LLQILDSNELLFVSCIERLEKELDEEIIFLHCLFDHQLVIFSHIRMFLGLQKFLKLDESREEDEHLVSVELSFAGHSAIEDILQPGLGLQQTDQTVMTLNLFQSFRHQLFLYVDVVQHFLTDSADPQLLFGQRFFRCGRLLGGGVNLMDGHTSIV